MVTKERTLLQDSISLGLGFRERGIQQQTLKRDFSLEMTTSTFPLSHFSSCSRTGLSSQPLWSSLSTSNTPPIFFHLGQLLKFFLPPETLSHQSSHGWLLFILHSQIEYHFLQEAFPDYPIRSSSAFHSTIHFLMALIILCNFLMYQFCLCFCLPETLASMKAYLSCPTCHTSLDAKQILNLNMC